MIATSFCFFLSNGFGSQSSASPGPRQDFGACRRCNCCQGSWGNPPACQWQTSTCFSRRNSGGSPKASAAGGRCSWRNSRFGARTCKKRFGSFSPVNIQALTDLIFFNAAALGASATKASSFPVVPRSRLASSQLKVSSTWARPSPHGACTIEYSSELPLV